jgi:hypothetical protein
LIKDAITGVKTWLGNMFKFDSGHSLLATAFNVALFLPNIIFKGLTLVGEWLLKLFGFDDAAEKVANAGNFTLGGLIMGAVDAIVCWFTELLSWGETDAGDWSLVTMISTAVDKIFAWFKGLFDIDWGGLMDKLVPDWVKKIIPGFSDTPEEKAEKEAEKTAVVKEAIKELEVKAGKDFNLELGSLQKTQLQKMLNDITPALGFASEAQQAQMDVLAQEIAKRKMGGPVKKGVPYLVGEGSVKPELFVPSNSGMILSAQRTSQMLQAGLQRGAAAGGGVGGGGAVTNIDARSTSSVTATGNTGQGPIRNNKYAGLNTVAA